MVITAHAAPRSGSAAAPGAIHPWQSDGDARGPAAASLRRDLAGAPTSAAAQPSSTSSSVRGYNHRLLGIPSEAIAAEKHPILMPEHGHHRAEIPMGKRIRRIVHWAIPG
jgi:hypothetical protein